MPAWATRDFVLALLSENNMVPDRERSSGRWLLSLFDPSCYWLGLYDGRRVVGAVRVRTWDWTQEGEFLYVSFDGRLRNKVEAVREAVQKVFADTPLERLTVEIPTHYRAVTAFLQKCGFKLEGVKERAGRWNGKVVDCNVLGCVR